jgi:outer membrane receptor protein involved in Fe transport
MNDVVSGSRNRQRTIAVVSSLLAMTVAATLADAQQKAAKDKDDVLEEVVVTGSRIARPDLDRLEPTTVISAATMDQRGYTDVGAALSELPGFGVPPSNASNVQSTNGIAQSYVDLYGLGSQRTLTLVDGRRFVSGNSPAAGGAVSPGGQVDLNVIPTKLIERVETISVGGAPIYGADAIAGTVNIILKHNYEGFDLDVQAGQSSRADAASRRIRALWGTNFADGKGNVTWSAEYSDAKGLLGTDRPEYAKDLSFIKPLNAGTYTQTLVSGLTVTGINFGGVPLVDDFFFAPGIGIPASAFGVTNAAGQVLAFPSVPHSGTSLVPYNLGSTFYNNPVFSSNGDGERLSQTSNLLSPLQKLNTQVLGSYQLNDQVRLFGEGWFSSTHAQNLIAQPQYNTYFFGAAGQPNGSVKIDINNPFLTTGDRALIQSALNAYGANPSFGAYQDPNWNNHTFYLSRANMDLQSGVATGDQITDRFVLGADGKFNFSGHEYRWEVSGNWGYNRNTSVQPSVIWQNFLNAVNAVKDANGNIVCAPGAVNAPVSSVSSSCAPLDLFGAGTPSQAARDYITHLATASSITTQRDFVANISGGLFQMPAGEAKGSLGYENRRESADFRPDSFYTGAYGESAAVLPIAGSYRTNELFGEVLIPLTSVAQNLPLLRSTEFEAAARRVDNTIAGNSTTWTAGLHWSPIQDLMFRGNKTHSIRAPAITELFLPSVPTYSFANDPCDVNFIGQGLDPATRAKNCAAAGIPAVFNSNVVNATALGSNSGNTHLTSETAASQSVGVVIQPRWIRHLNLTVDYIDINLTNAISSLSLTNIMDSCYDAASYPNNQYCSLFQRDPKTHQVVNFEQGFVNAGVLHFTGVQLGADYRFDLPQGLGDMALRANYLDTRKLTSQIGSVPVQETAGQIGTNKGRGSLDAIYHHGKFAWDWQGLYTGSANFSNTNPVNYQNYMTVHPWWVINSTLSYELPHDVTARVIVDNVFNKLPPFPAIAGSGGNYATGVSQYFSGLMGRYFLVSLDAHF